MRTAIWAVVIACVPIYAEPAAAAVHFIEASVETGVQITGGDSQNRISTGSDHSTTQRELHSQAAVAETRSSDGYIDRIYYSLSGTASFFGNDYVDFSFQRDISVDLHNPPTPSLTSDEIAFGSYTFSLDGTTHLDLRYFGEFGAPPQLGRSPMLRLSPFRDLDHFPR